MKKRTPVKEIMTENMKTVQLSDSLKSAKFIMDNESIRHLPVMRGDNLVGILSDSDFNRLNFGSIFNQEPGSEYALMETLTIEQLMTFKPVTVDTTATVKEVIDIFMNEHFRALPVIENGKPVGIVTVTDVLGFISENM
ncbi:MAG: CBS domain-containing protein [Flavobacteriales bacterium]|nr:CBS domain-containing protein [Flavobacteriales bacterium]